MRKSTILVLVALVLLVVLVAAIIMALLFWRYGLRPETAAVAIASATIIGALATQVVNAYIARSNQKHTQELADQRAQAEALQTYLQRMSELVERNLRAVEDPYSEMRILARVQTKTVLRGLDPVRKRDLLLFLREMRLINRDKYEAGPLKVFPQVVGLSGADLKDACLRDTRLISTSREEPINLEGAILQNADLTRADLEGADLSGAIMREALLIDANLSNASLKETDLTDAKLNGVDLTNVDLTGATVSATNSQLKQQAKSLKGATMPDGSKNDN